MRIRDPALKRVSFSDVLVCALIGHSGGCKAMSRAFTRFGFGCEHEVAFLNPAGHFADHANTSFAEVAAIIARLPVYDDDIEQLVNGKSGIKRKRWYLEGQRRFSPDGQFIDFRPKGIEIRTTIHPTIQGAINELRMSFTLLMQHTRDAGFVPALTSFHPYKDMFVPDPPMNAFERRLYDKSPEMRSSAITMLTYGPDLNISCPELTPEEVLDRGRKLTFYSPYIVPFSFSSPFFQGRPWGGLSIRTLKRTGMRPATLVFVEHAHELIDSDPSLTQLARLPREVGRIEFKACDSSADFSLYASLLALLKGLLIDETLEGRMTVPDPVMHQLAARSGFQHPEIEEGARAVVRAATIALERVADPDVSLLARLHEQVQRKITPAHELLRLYEDIGSIEEALRIAGASTG